MKYPVSELAIRAFVYFSLKFTAPWSEKHSWNIASEAKQFLKAKLKIVVKAEHPENISLILVT